MAQVDVRTVWPLCRKHVAKATKRSGGRYSDVDVLIACMNGTMQLWVVRSGPEVHCVCITEVNKHPGGLELNIVLIGGRNGVHWRHYLNDIEEWGREQGCRWAVATGRRGLTRLLGDGWNETRREFGKEL